MSDGLQWEQVRERVAGKWQIPVVVLSAIALAASWSTYKTPSSKVPFDRLVGELPMLIDRGLYTAAIDTAERLLRLPDRTAREFAPVYAALGRARLERIRRSGAQVPRIASAVIDHFKAAEAGGVELTPKDFERLGTAHEWLGDLARSVEYLDAAVARMERPSLDLRWRVAKLRLRRGLPDRQRRHVELDGLIGDASERPKVLVWALDEKTVLLTNEGRYEEAGRAIEAAGAHLTEGRPLDWHAYLRAYVDYRAGRRMDAEVSLRVLRDGSVVRDELFARSGWLLGRTVLGDDEPERPAEALTYFREVVSFSPSKEYRAAAELGAAESLAMLERFDESLERFRAAASMIRALPANYVVDVRVIETTLLVAGVRVRSAVGYEAALRYSRLAAGLDENGPVGRRTLLLERLAGDLTALARANRTRAAQLRDPRQSAVLATANVPLGPEAREDDPDALDGDARALLLESGRVHQRIARLNTMDDERRGEALWDATERIRESGDSEATVRAARRYLDARPGSLMTARALRYLGRAQQSLGRFAEAVETYQEAHRRFPRTPDGGESLLALAECFASMGSEYVDRVEATLRLVLDDSDVFTPSAPEYASALFLLGETFNRNGGYELAIPVLEEALERYPSDSRIARARFLLGDSFLRSGLALDADMESASFVGRKEHAAAERDRRLRRAAELFVEMIADYEARDASSLSESDELYLRHARLYLADAHFELGDYDSAVAAYERAAWIYKGTQTTLAAYVQIINSYTFSGNPEEASAALRRAQYLVETMPAAAFEDALRTDRREDWREYFKWVEQSGLF